MTMTHRCNSLSYDTNRGKFSAKQVLLFLILEVNLDDNTSLLFKAVLHVMEYFTGLYFSTTVPEFPVNFGILIRF